MKWTLFSIGLGVAVLAGTWGLVRNVEASRLASRAVSGVSTASDSGACSSTGSGLVDDAWSVRPSLQSAEPAKDERAIAGSSSLSEQRIDPMFFDPMRAPLQRVTFPTLPYWPTADPEPNPSPDSVDYRFFSRASPLRFERPQAPQPPVSP